MTVDAIKINKKLDMKDKYVLGLSSDLNKVSCIRYISKLNEPKKDNILLITTILLMILFSKKSINNVIIDGTKKMKGNGFQASIYLCAYIFNRKPIEHPIRIDEKLNKINIYFFGLNKFILFKYPTYTPKVKIGILLKNPILKS